MDFLSFVLGMCVVVVIAVAIVAVMSFVKVNRHNKEIDNLHQIIGREIDNLNQYVSREFSEQNRERENIVQDIFRTIDSRLDKLESKLSRKEA